MINNLVLITIDSLRADFSRCFGISTPFLSYLYRRSVVMENAVAAGVPTFFSFPSMFTGDLPFEHGYYLGIRRNVLSLAEFLKSKGYITLAVVSDNPALYPSYGYNKGFDIYIYKSPFSNRRNKRKRSKVLKNKKKKGITGEFAEILRSIYRTVKQPSITMEAKEVNYLAKKMLKSLKKKFFLWLHYMDVHCPYYSGVKYLGLEDNILNDLITKYTFYKNLWEPFEQLKISDERLLRIFRRAYGNSIVYVDYRLREIVDYILDLYPNTLFVITSDHGEAFMEHGYFFHEPYILYDELIKVPLIFYSPYIEGRKVKKNVSLLSLPKTVSEFLVGKSPFQGVNLLEEKELGKSYCLNNVTEILYACRSPHIRQGILDNRTEIRGYYEMFSFRTSKYKYIINLKNKKEELYDLEIDPHEKVNLLNDKLTKEELSFYTTTRKTIEKIIKKRLIISKISRLKHKL